MKNKVNFSVKDSRGIHVIPSILVGDAGNYSSGDILDANATEQLIVSKIHDLIGTAGPNVDTLGEIAQAIPTKVSDLTNDSGYVTSTTVISSQPFPVTWPTNGYINETTDNEDNPVHGLIWAINHDDNATPGKTYLSTVRYEDLPSDELVQVEMKVEIMSEEPSLADMELSTGTKVILFTVTSSAVEPYHWEATSVYGGDITWRSFAMYEEEPSL